MHLPSRTALCTICEELRALRCERELDAKMNAEMLERQKTDPVFTEEQRRLVEEFMRQFCECTSKPDCPCEFCVALRFKHASGKLEKEELNQAAEDFLGSYPRNK